MSRRLLLLNGLAILAVVCNHATNYAFIAMFWWTDRYRPVTVPNYDWLGSPAYYGTVAIQQLAMFSVPAFLFVSGFFVAYAARSKGNELSWKFVRNRITALLWPYLIWMVIYLVVEALQGKTNTLVEYIRRVLTGDVAGPFYFVPLLCQFYLMAPFIVRWAKNRPTLLLIIAFAIQVIAGLLLMVFKFTNQDLAATIFSNAWLFIWHTIYFPLGVVIGFRWSATSAILARFKWVLVAVTVTLGLMSIGVDEWLRQMQHEVPGYQEVTLLPSFYALAFVLAFLSFAESKGFIAKVLGWLGTNSYGIYLVHLLVMGWLARAIQHFFPWLLAQPLLFMSVLVAADILVVATFMKGVARSPARKWYRYLFG
jgi:peptidoglycan/LPS O-acetylase OafA/YrhL